METVAGNKYGTLFSILGVLAILGIAAYFLIYKPWRAKNPSTGGPIGGGLTGDGSGSTTPGIGEGGIVVPLGYGSKKVNVSDIVVASNPSSYFTGINESDATSYNVLTTKKTPLSKLHFLVGFNTPSCDKYVWYKNCLYTLIGTTLDSTGRTCYYKFDASVFPQKLTIRTISNPPACSNYTYYISGVEYKFDKMDTVVGSGFNATTKYYCQYNKQ